MFNTLLSDNVLRIKFVIRIIRNTRIKQLRYFVNQLIIQEISLACPIRLDLKPNSLKGPAILRGS